MDSAVKVALIVAIPTTITALGTLSLQFLARRDAKKSLSNQDELKVSMDGHFTKLLADRKEQGDELVDKSQQLARAEGRREGMEASDIPK